MNRRELGWLGLALKLERELPGIEALVVDDTGFPKKGVHSVGVARQYSGTLGRTDNCQVATSLHLAGEAGSGCIGLSLYLSETWAADLPRRQKVGVPAEIGFLRKWEISLAQIDAALRWGVRKHVVLADAGYGDASEFRNGLLSRGLDYVVGVSGTAVVWPPGSNPLIPPQEAGARGRPRTRYFDPTNPPVAMSVIARDLAYRTVKWRSGSRAIQSSRFAAVRIKTAHKHINGVPPSELQWLMCEWPQNEDAPTKFYLSSLPARTSLKALVRFAKLRWRIERDYQELKQELGLDHFEGRSWRGFHHHATLCSVAHGFLALRRALFPPERHQMDPADGSSSPSVRSSLAAGGLPALPADLHSWRATARPLAAVKEAIE